MIEAERARPLNRRRPRPGQYVLYWMQASQRAEYNHALEFAIEQANDMNLPVIVYFGLTESFPEANERHYCFMLQGLKEVREVLRDRGIGLVIEQGSPETGVVNMAAQAALTVCDRGYLRIQRQWRHYAAERLECPLLQVESDTVVPVETASDKEEYSAATLRRKLYRHLYRYLIPVRETGPRIDSSRLVPEGYNLSDIPAALAGLDLDRSAGTVASITGGPGPARQRLDTFINYKLDSYAELRNDPNEDALSGLSPYLHFGQISPLYIALQVSRHNSPGREAFLEELLVRRELSLNFVHYNRRYDTFAGLPDWVRRTLAGHAGDPREYVYSPETLEQAQTHDPYWNAAQREMTDTGKMHGYMRMYWGKKILEWTADPVTAFQTALYLNNKYELDGRDANGFAGVAWCFGKHDRPWANRSIFGNVRYMNAAGLKRKFDADSYARRYAP